MLSLFLCLIKQNRYILTDIAITCASRHKNIIKLKGNDDAYREIINCVCAGYHNSIIALRDDKWRCFAGYLNMDRTTYRRSPCPQRAGRRRRGRTTANEGRCIDTDTKSFIFVIELAWLSM